MSVRLKVQTAEPRSGRCFRTLAILARVGNVSNVSSTLLKRLHVCHVNIAKSYEYFPVISQTYGTEGVRVLTKPSC